MTEKKTTETPPTVQQRFVAAMRDVASVGKGEQANMGRGGSFKFRGIDAVMNAVGPAFRTHGLFLMPELINQEYERVPRGNGGMMISTVVTVCFHVMCEESGQEITGVSVGEANDTADKATAKAMSVALHVHPAVDGPPDRRAGPGHVPQRARRADPAGGPR